MKILECRSYEEINTIIQNIELERYQKSQIFNEFYRGQPNNHYKLLPNLFRQSDTIDNFSLKEKRVFEAFSKLAKTDMGLQSNPEFEKYLYGLKWSLLTQGQHLGLLTRLLDWTINWEIALLFAVFDQNHIKEDAQLWILKCPSQHQINDSDKSVLLEQDPFKINNWYLINLPFFQWEPNDLAERRRFRQYGRFLIQPIENAVFPIENQMSFSDNLLKIVIPAAYKMMILKDLNDRDVTIDWAYYRKNEEIDNRIIGVNMEQ